MCGLCLVFSVLRVWLCVSVLFMCYVVVCDCLLGVYVLVCVLCSMIMHACVVCVIMISVCS